MKVINHRGHRGHGGLKKLPRRLVSYKIPPRPVAEIGTILDRASDVATALRCRVPAAPLKERGRPAHIFPFQWAERPHSLIFHPPSAAPRPSLDSGHSTLFSYDLQIIP
jgi:hypothetical protein